MKRLKETTSTTRVFEALRAADDFCTGRHLQVVLSLDSNHVSAALYHLRKYHAADYIEQPDALWWFATPESDLRCRVVDERTPESRPRKPRRRKLP